MKKKKNNSYRIKMEKDLEHNTNVVNKDEIIKYSTKKESTKHEPLFSKKFNSLEEFVEAYKQYVYYRLK